VINNAAAGDVPSFEPAIGDMIEVAESVRVLQLAVLAEVLDVIGPLDLVKHGTAAEIRTCDGIAVAVEIEAPGVAASFGKELEFLGDWMIAPDSLLKRDAADMGRHRAALSSVEPAVRPPLK